MLRTVAEHLACAPRCAAADNAVLAETLTKDAAMKERADQVLGSLTHLSTAAMPDGYSQFFERGEGARVWDLDGKEYIDFMCSYGPISVGHLNPRVQAAIAAQMKMGDALSGPSEQMVKLAEKLVDMTPWAAWCTFQKNGSDATSLAVRYARASNGKRVLLRAPGSYHGATPLWQTTGSPGVLEEEFSHQLHYEFNNLQSVRNAVQEANGDFSAIIVAAFKWDFFADLEMPTIEFLSGVREICDEHGAALILDDIRSTLRLNLAGSWAGYGIDPDLMCYCKGIANGQPLAAVLGAERYREAAGKVRATGSFWSCVMHAELRLSWSRVLHLHSAAGLCSLLGSNAVPFAAALATIEELEEGGITRMERAGTQLRKGLYDQASKYGLSISHSGPVQMPLLIFNADRALGPPTQNHKWERITLWASECAKRGVWFHPFHNNFLSAAHTSQDISDTLAVTDQAFAIVAAKFGKDQ